MQIWPAVGVQPLKIAYQQLGRPLEARLGERLEKSVCLLNKNLNTHTHSEAQQVSAQINQMVNFKILIVLFLFLVRRCFRRLHRPLELARWRSGRTRRDELPPSAANKWPFHCRLAATCRPLPWPNSAQWWPSICQIETLIGADWPAALDT